MKADEVIHLKPKKRGMIATLLLSALRSFWTGLTARNGWYEPMDADYMPAESVPEPPASLVPYRRSMPIRRISWRLTQNRRRDRLRKQRTSRMKSSTA